MFVQNLTLKSCFYIHLVKGKSFFELTLNLILTHECTKGLWDITTSLKANWGPILNLQVWCGNSKPQCTYLEWTFQWRRSTFKLLIWEGWRGSLEMFIIFLKYNFGPWQCMVGDHYSNKNTICQVMSVKSKEWDVVNTQLLCFTLRYLWKNVLLVTNIYYNLAIFITKLAVVPKIGDSRCGCQSLNQYYSESPFTLCAIDLPLSLNHSLAFWPSFGWG